MFDKNIFVKVNALCFECAQDSKSAFISCIAKANGIKFIRGNIDTDRKTGAVQGLSLVLIIHIDFTYRIYVFS